MTVTIKTADEQDKMRIAGRLAADVLDMIGDYVKPGVTTGELDRICHEYITEVQNAIPAPLNYRGFPKSICTSNGDTSRMFFAGKPSIQARRLADVAFESMWLGIEELAPGKHLGDVGAAIQHHVEKNRCSVVREYCGHGIGRVFHEDPQVLHYGSPGTGLELRAGMTLTVEPMVNAGKAAVKLLPDGWTVVTKDHSLSAQWEHTVLVTETGHEVLTLGADAR
jgi:methionine aminopeptidase